MDQQFATIGSVAFLCLLFGQMLKKSTIARKWIPSGTAICGAVLGFLGMRLDVPGLVELDAFDAIATGAFSGLMSSGIFSWYKNTCDKYPNND
jgi:hypothetical protein